MFWRRADLGDLANPFFRLARHTSAREEDNHWMLFGCEHANAISYRRGPMRNRLRLAVLWRREWARLMGELRTPGLTEEQRAIVVRRLGHDYQETLI